MFLNLEIIFKNKIIIINKNFFKLVQNQNLKFIFYKNGIKIKRLNYILLDKTYKKYYNK